MENKNTILEDARIKILSEVISFVSIIDVAVKNPDENNIHLYIKTNDIKTVEMDKLNGLVKKFSTDKISITYQVPINKMIGEITIPNLDSVCIFIEYITEFDPASSFAF